MKSKTIAMTAMLSITVATVAFAHGGATGIVKERMDAMSAMGDTIKTLTPIMRGQVAYDEEAVRRGASEIAEHAKSITGQFPEGTAGKPSEAREEIWTDWKTFEALANRLTALATGLEKAAGNGLMMSSDSGTTNMMGGSQGMMGQGTMGHGMMGQGMMGQGMMGQGMMDADMPLPDGTALAAMPADGLFNMIAQTCSSCHTQFRHEEH